MIAEPHEAVLTKPGSKVTRPVSDSSVGMAIPPGPSVAGETVSGSEPPGCCSETYVMSAFHERLRWLILIKGVHPVLLVCSGEV